MTAPVFCCNHACARVTHVFKPKQLIMTDGFFRPDGQIDQDGDASALPQSFVKPPDRSVCAAPPCDRNDRAPLAAWVRAANFFAFPPRYRRDNPESPWPGSAIRNFRSEWKRRCRISFRRPHFRRAPDFRSRCNGESFRGSDADSKKGRAGCWQNFDKIAEQSSSVAQEVSLPKATSRLVRATRAPRRSIIEATAPNNCPSW